MSNAAKNFFNMFEGMNTFGSNWQNTMPNFMNSNAQEKMREQANRNMQTMAAMAQVCAESAQAMARRSAEVMQKNAQNCMEGFRDACASQSPEEAQRAGSSAASNLFKDCCGSARDNTEMAAKLTLKMIDMADSIACESLKEWANCCRGGQAAKADKK